MPALVKVLILQAILGVIYLENISRYSFFRHSIRNPLAFSSNIEQNFLKSDLASPVISTTTSASFSFKRVAI